MEFSDINVLVVDDNEDVLALLENDLHNMGLHYIATAANGQEALARIKAADAAGTPIEMVLCDWNMPDMSGIELLRYLRDHGSPVPFIMITGRGGGLQSFHEAQRAEVTSFVQKPCSPTRLEVEMRMAMQRQLAA